MASRQQTINRLIKLADSLGPGLRSAFLRSVDNLKNRIDFKTVERLLEQNQFGQIMDLFSRENIDAGFTGFSQKLTDAYIAGGTLGAELTPILVGNNGIRFEVVFDQVNPELTRVFRDYKMNLIREITVDTRSTVQDKIAEMVTEGVNPKETARKIRDSLGLTRTQERAVQKYRRSLETLSTDALARKLRDKRFDASVARAIRNGEPLNKDKIDKMVNRYRERFLKHRAETVARTESIRSLSMANKQLFDNLVQEGKLDERRVRRFWIFTRDSRTRHAHRTIPSMNKEGVGLNEKFRSELGPIMFPGDPNASPSNVINCRCTVFHRILEADVV